MTASHTPQVRQWNWTVLEAIGLQMFRDGNALSYRGQCRVMRLVNAGRILRPAK